MLKKTLIITTAICAIVPLSISEIAYAQINELKITPSDGVEFDRFGTSVSISGDYAIVGAFFDDNENMTGSAYLFVRDGESWREEAKLLASDGGVFDLFGASVSISGDYAVVGAILDDDNGKSLGSAYVFKRTGAIWAQEAKLLASDGMDYDYFGNSVSISGDYVVVGAPSLKVSATGSAYVFKRTGTTWTQEAKLLASDGAATDFFGWSVSISGDYAVVGAFGDDDNGSSSGSAYVFKRTDTTWTEEAKMLPSDGAGGDNFGGSVSISGDYAVVGAKGDEDNGHASGSAYVFKRTGPFWAQEAKLLPSDGAADNWFGWSVSISGDYAVVSNLFYVEFGTGLASAYVFKRTGTTWTEEVKLLPSDGAVDDQFGISVSISGDDIIVGAELDDDNGRRSGSAYLYDGFSSLVDVEGVTVSPRYAVPGMDSIVVTAAAAGPADLSVFAEIESPNGVPLDTILLFDDGAHHDGEASDSVFGNVWQVPPVEERIYLVDFHFSYVDTDTVNSVLNNGGLFTTIGPVVFERIEFLADSAPNPGDNIFIKLFLRNNGSTATAADISLELSTTDTCVSRLFQNDKTFGDIPAGQSTATGINYGVGINENCPSDHDIIIDISISSEGFDFWSDSFSLQLIPVGITDEEAIIPDDYSLVQNYPNPFNPVTVIGYALPKSSDVSLVIYNLMGQEVHRWDIQGQHAGNYRVTWDASSVASGVYLYRLRAGDFIQTRKMLLLK